MVTHNIGRVWINRVVSKKVANPARGQLNCFFPVRVRA